MSPGINKKGSPVAYRRTSPAFTLPGVAALIDTDFWSVRTIVEDGHQYWRSYFRFDSKYEVYPVFVPIYQDAVLTEKYTKTLKMQFIQVRRWAWGASDIAYVAYTGFFKKNHIPNIKIISKFLRLLEGHLSWSTSPLILLLAALVPFFLYPQSYAANQLPQVAKMLQTIAMLGILISIILTTRMLPPKPARYKRRRNLWMLLQWIYLYPYYDYLQLFRCHLFPDTVDVWVVSGLDYYRESCQKVIPNAFRDD